MEYKVPCYIKYFSNGRFRFCVLTRLTPRYAYFIHMGSDGFKLIRERRDKAVTKFKPFTINSTPKNSLELISQRTEDERILAEVDYVRDITK